MTALSKIKKKNALSEIKAEEIINARAVSRGYAIGKAICLHGRRRQFYRYELTAAQIAGELRRYRAAVRLAVRQLKKIAGHDGISRTIKADIFAAHLLILEDKSLHTKIEAIIEGELLNAEWAVKTVTEDFVAQYKAAADERLRERYIDLEDVADRILTALGGGKTLVPRLPKNSIIIAKEVRPSTLIELADSEPLAIVTENGGWTSHTFILTREMNLPAVTGVKRILRLVHNGDELIVDGFGGQIILHPAKESVRRFQTAAKQFNNTQTSDTAAPHKPLKTLDGGEITIRANLDLPKGYAQAKQSGARGVGLYRSEFLFNQYKGFPSEHEQIEAYRKIAKLVGGDGVRIRTFDLSVEQLADESQGKEKNPALGLRAIRLAFAHSVELRRQLRALLQAAHQHNISVVLPMISDVDEILRTAAVLKRERNWLRRRNIEAGELKIGAMIEVPAAVLTIDEIAAEVDFLCLGTNDLVQYLLAVDRDNESVADWFRTLHPAVLRAVKTVVRAADEKEIPVIVCGEMAGSPVYVPILLGLGVRELSMNINSIGRVRNIISQIALEETRELVAKLEVCRTADAVEAAVTEFYTENWSHLFPKDIFPPKRKFKI